MKTVGELKAFIKDLPDDMLLANYEIDMETSGYRNRLFCEVTKMHKETKRGYDSFDGISYDYEVLEKAEDGEEYLRIY